MSTPTIPVRPQRFRFLAATPTPATVGGAPPALFPAWVLLFFIGLGLAWRLCRYLLQFPIWPDEAFVCLNLIDQTYAGLAQPLRFIQIAPYLFLCTELTAYQWLGPSELSLRLASLVASCAGLLLFARLARRVLDRDAATLAAGILAVSYFCVQYSAEVKPYALDLCMSVGFLLLGYGWLQTEAAGSLSPGGEGWGGGSANERNEQPRTEEPKNSAFRVPSSALPHSQFSVLGSPFFILLMFTPLALGFSYPSVFVAGGVGLSLAVTWLRQPTRGLLMRLVVFGLVLVGSFVAYYFLVGVGQFKSAGAEQNPYWNEWFFPWKEPLKWPLWLWQTHAGALFAYPLGQRDGASTATLLLFLVGGGVMLRQRRGLVLLLLLAPFALTLLASALGRYPYGGNARVAQHLAPSIILLAGLGGATILRWASGSLPPGGGGLGRGGRHEKDKNEEPRTENRESRTEDNVGKCVKSDSSLPHSRFSVLRSSFPLSARLVVLALALLALGGMARDAWQPAKSGNDLLARQIAQEIADLRQPEAPILLLGKRSELMTSLEWYLSQLPNQKVWHDELSADGTRRLTPAARPVIVLALRRNASDATLEESFPSAQFPRRFDRRYHMKFQHDPGDWGWLRVVVLDSHTTSWHYHP